MRTICAVVLVFEAVVIGLAIPVAIQLAGFAPGVAAGVWGGMALVALVLAGLQRRFAWAHYAGWVLQFAMLVSGFFVPMFWILGVIFLVLWIVGIMLGRKTDAMQAEHAASAERAGVAEQTGSAERTEEPEGSGRAATAEHEQRS